MSEVFRPVEGFEGIYEISNMGRVKSVCRISAADRVLPEKILKPGHTTAGYPFVVLRKGGKSYNKPIHRLVATAFIPNPNCYRVVNHKDRNRDNNTAENLEWCSQGYNISYSLNKLGMSHTHRGREVRVTVAGKELVFNSMTACSRFLGYNKRWLSIRMLKQGKHFEYKGCRFDIGEETR